MIYSLSEKCGLERNNMLMVAGNRNHSGPCSKECDNVPTPEQSSGEYGLEERRAVRADGGVVVVDGLLKVQPVVVDCPLAFAHGGLEEKEKQQRTRLFAREQRLHRGNVWVPSSFVIKSLQQIANCLKIFSTAADVRIQQTHTFVAEPRERL